MSADYGIYRQYNANCKKCGEGVITGNCTGSKIINYKQKEIGNIDKEKNHDRIRD
jgi:hypothetical protein